MKTKVAVPTINILSELVADAIAAGEVIERPASVVKELCENSLDAGATRIDVSIEGNGLAKIRVADNGCGIKPAELTLAVARHATSKVKDLVDLEAISSLGFRGEALSSVGAVSELTISSRVASETSGHLLKIKAGKIINQSKVAAAVGTTIEVRDLFFNTPARLKFLKTDRTEVNLMKKIVQDLALANPNVAFNYSLDNKVVFQSKGGTLRQVMQAAFGKTYKQEGFLDVNYEDDVASVIGVMSHPAITKSNREDIVLVVNGRRIYNQRLLTAVDLAYKGLLPMRQYPCGVLNISVEASEVDVNVHPAKREVKFHKDGEVFSAVHRACLLIKENAQPSVGEISWQINSPTGGAASSLEALLDSLPVADETQAIASNASAETVSSVPHKKPLLGYANLNNRPSTDTSASITELFNEEARVASAESDMPSEQIQIPGMLDEPVTSTPNANFANLGYLKAIGQSKYSWIIADSAIGVVLVDTHAAHEKVKYEQILNSWGTTGGLIGRKSLSGNSQLNIQNMSELVECTDKQMAAFEEHHEFLQTCGFLIEEFGPNMLKVEGLPVQEGSAKDALREILNILGENIPLPEMQKAMAASVACHAAVRFGQKLVPEVQQAILDELITTSGGITCPHGRPALMILDNDSLRKSFRRT